MSRTTPATDGLAALNELRNLIPDLMLLDIMIPELTGYEVCRQARANGIPIPIIMLTAKGQEEDIVRGLNLGADDYVTKPFNLNVLLARVAAGLRRQETTAEESIEFGECRLDRTSYRLFRRDNEVELTPKEFRLLEYFLQNQGRVLTRNQILNGVWGSELMVADRSVGRCINTLRGKIEPNPKHPHFIQTIRDVGYRFETE